MNRTKQVRFMIPKALAKGAPCEEKDLIKRRKGI